METLFVTGKGGVGKTSAAIAIARAYARAGKRTWIIELGNGGGVSERFRTPISPIPTLLETNVWAVHMNYEWSVESYLKHSLPRAPYEILKRSTAFGLLAMAAPQVKELACIGAVMHAGENDECDVAIVDLPASGHAYALLSASETFLKMVPTGPLSQSAHHAADFISSSRCVIVTKPEQTPVLETIETTDQLIRYVRDIGWLLNADLPEPLTEAESTNIPPSAQAAFELETERAYRAQAARKTLYDAAGDHQCWSVNESLDIDASFVDAAEEVMTWNA